MSQENVEVVRRTFAAWNAGDMDALRELHDPDVFVRAPKGWPEQGRFVGREAVMRQFEQLFAPVASLPGLPGITHDCRGFGQRSRRSAQRGPVNTQADCAAIAGAHEASS